MSLKVKYSENLSFAPPRSATLRHAPPRSASIRHAPLRSATLRFDPPRSALLRLAPPRSASLRHVPLRSATLRFAPPRFAPLTHPWEGVTVRTMKMKMRNYADWTHCGTPFSQARELESDLPRTRFFPRLRHSYIATFRFVLYAFPYTSRYLPFLSITHFRMFSRVFERRSIINHCTAVLSNLRPHPHP